MSDGPDRDLARRLATIEVPDHRPGFWGDLRADLENSTREASDSDAHFVEFAATEVVELSDAVQRRRPRRLLAAAAVVLVAVVSAGVVASFDGGGDSADVATDPSPTADPRPTDAPNGPAEAGPSRPLRAVGDPIERGPGTVVALDPTGRFLYTAAPAPDGGTGCEGMPRQALYVESVDGAGGRRLAAPPDIADATGGIEVRFSTAGEMAVVSSCEGYGNGLVTGTVDADGTLADPVSLAIQGVESILDLEFRSRGVLVAATYAPRGGADSDFRLYELSVEPSEVTDLGQDGITELAVTDDGRLATVSVDGVARLDGAPLGAAAGALDVLTARDGSWVVVQGADGVVSFDTTSGASRTLDVSGSTIGLRPTGSGTVVVEEVVGDDQSVRLVEVDLRTGAQLGTVLEALALGRGFVITPSADVLFVGTAVGAGDPMIVEQRLTRG